MKTENPKNIYRIENGCTFEDIAEAHHESIQNAAYDLMDALRKESYVKNGDELLANKNEIKKLISCLSSALNGKHITTYKIDK